MKDKYDLIIVGAGPAGLTAGISAKSNSDMNILILEKQMRPGNRSRGETLKFDPFLENKIFDPGFIDKITVNKTSKYRFYSPSNKKYIEIEALQKRYMINWHEFINALVEKAIKNGIELQVKHEVKELIFKDEIYQGVKGVDDFKGFEVKSNLLILADGSENSIINKYGYQTPKENHLILKVIAENVNFKENIVELFFSTGENMPPGVLSIFPRSETSAEANYVQFADSNAKDLRFWWDKICSEMPIFSDRFKNSSILHFDIARLPFGGPTLDVLVPTPRIFLAGDNAGHVPATSGAGLVSSMKMAHEIGKIVSEIHGSGEIDKYFSSDTMKQITKRLRKTAIYRDLKEKAQVAVDIRKAFFKTLITPEKIDEKWDTFIAPTLKNAVEFF
ncbi:MAG: NAD(P)/FAD-dependent oxidoreductase [Candidatus Helarchaeota archaeon]|nr:NAD(P)/FAD-dependent oxidoreductase [Candidatus Helarchaeota archaeon]